MSKLIILIDDDKTTQIWTTRILKLQLPELKIKNFTAAKEALKFIESCSREEMGDLLIFLDLNMPEMNGWQFLEILESQEMDIPIQIFVLTSSIDSDDHQKCSNYRLVNDFISKPLTRKKISELDI